MNWCVVCGW